MRDVMGKRKSRDRWPELCKLVESDDGLMVRSVGQWSEDKLYVWNRYIEITTNAMVGKPQWPNGLAYIDLFSGPGVCQIKGSNRRLPGSPLLAAYAKKPFRKIILCERDPPTATACQTRLRSLSDCPPFELFVDDCNALIDSISQAIPRGALSLALIDPTGLHAHLETICQLSNARQVDLLILFPDAIDAVRNTEKYYLPNEESKLDLVFGRGSGWRVGWNELPNHDASTIRHWFYKFYCKQLREQAGYSHFGEKVIKGRHGPLYRLVFAAKHQRGLDFWEKVKMKDASGQLDFNF